MWIYWRVVNQAVIGHLLVVRDEMLPETPRNQHVASAKMTVTDSIWNHRLKTSPWVFQATWPPYDHPTTNWCSPKKWSFFHDGFRDIKGISHLMEVTTVIYTVIYIPIDSPHQVWWTAHARISVRTFDDKCHWKTSRTPLLSNLAMILKKKAWLVGYFIQ